MYLNIHKMKKLPNTKKLIKEAEAAIRKETAEMFKARIIEINKLFLSKGCSVKINQPKTIERIRDGWQASFMLKNNPKPEKVVSVKFYETGLLDISLIMEGELINYSERQFKVLKNLSAVNPKSYINILIDFLNGKK